MALVDALAVKPRALESPLQAAFLRLPCFNVKPYMEVLKY